MAAKESLEFTATLDHFHSNLWGFHIVVPEPVARPFLVGSSRRVVCTLNDMVTFQCALMPKGDGHYFININKKIRSQLGLEQGMSVRASLRRDESEYGLPMPEELAELLKIDEEGNELFHALTPGRQRSLLYIVSQPKRSDTRIRRALVVVDHLKANKGKLNFRQLGEALRQH